LAKKKIKKTASPVKSLKGQEREYQKHLNKLGRAMVKAVREELLPYLKANQSGYTLDGISDQLGVIYRRLNGLFTGVFTLGFAKITASQMVEKVGNANKNRFNRSINRATGIDLGSVIQTEGLEDFIASSINTNVKLISTLPEQYLSQVEVIVNKGVASGARYDTIAREIMGKTGASSKLAKRIGVIARNEVQTINSQLTLRRSSALGIKRGIYRTSEDEKVRTCHRELNGVEYDLVKGAWSKSCKKFIQPGITDINCRCSYSPVIKMENL